LSQLSIDEVLSPGRSDLSVNLAGKIQTALDARAAGVEVVALEIPMLRPSGNSAEKFEELNIGVQASKEYEAKETNSISQNYTYLVGDAALADRVIKAIDEFYALRAADKQAQALEKRQEIEKLLAQGGGQAAQRIADAERERWVTLMKRRAEAAIVSSQLAAYRAAPRLFRQRELMRVYSEVLPTIDKYLLALDPRRVHVDMDLKKLNLIQSFAGVSEEEAQHK
jgi:regulator of protease activity HflC (stomatin/prohibitin superfamily)